jgi:hypothetical protein
MSMVLFSDLYCIIPFFYKTLFNFYVVFPGVIKSLELENQVLKLRNAQLELAGNTETLKG